MKNKFIFNKENMEFNAIISGNAIATDNAEVYGNAKTYDDARICYKKVNI